MNFIEQHNIIVLSKNVKYLSQSKLVDWLLICRKCFFYKLKELNLNSYNSQLKYYKELIQTFLNEMEEIIQEENNERSINALEEEKQILKEKIDKLIDLNLNGTISIETLQEKKAKLQSKINRIEKE